MQEDSHTVESFIKVKSRKQLVKKHINNLKLLYSLSDKNCG